MKNYTQILLVFLATTCGILLVNFTSQQTKPQLNKSIKITTDYKVKKTKEEWKKTLNDEEYRVLINKGTEYPGSGEYNIHMKEGVYNCKGCNGFLVYSVYLVLGDNR